MKLTHLALAMATVFTGSLVLSGCGSDDRQAAAPTPHSSQHAVSETISLPPAAEEEVSPSVVIARINGEDITELDLEVLEERMTQQVERANLFERIKEIKLVAQKARAEGLDQDPRVQARLRYIEDNQLANDYLSEFLTELVVPAERVQAMYDEFIETWVKEQEYKASHILVETEEQARELIEQLNDGADFGDLARAHSIDTVSGEQGGDLGWFRLEQMVPQFSAGVEALQPGQHSSDPVESLFGWHVIYLADQREIPPPTLEMLKPQLENQYRREQIEQLIDSLRNEANIEILTDLHGDPPTD